MCYFCGLINVSFFLCIFHFQFLSDHLSIIHYDFCIRLLFWWWCCCTADAALIALFIHLPLMLFRISLANTKCNTYTLHACISYSPYKQAHIIPQTELKVTFALSIPLFFCLLRSIAPIRKSNHPIVTRSITGFKNIEAKIAWRHFMVCL